MKTTDVKKTVREKYGSIAGNKTSCCGPKAPSCCGASSADEISRKIGYSPDELDAAPDGANLGLGCGNPVALASLKRNEVVLDLGAGGGFDAFLAAERVGNRGKVIGVDMTPEMVELARGNAEKAGCDNVEFRLGEIEHLPVADGAVDVVISNCVINLSVDKPAVFAEAYRTLRPGGRLLVSDIVLTGDLPEPVRESAAAYAGCIAGALFVEDYLEAISGAGFVDVVVVDKTSYPVEGFLNDPVIQEEMVEAGVTGEDVRRAGDVVLSVNVSAVKPE